MWHSRVPLPPSWDSHSGVVVQAGVFHRTSLFDGGLTTSAGAAAAAAVPPQHARISITLPITQTLAALAAACARCGAAGMLRVPRACPEGGSSPRCGSAACHEEGCSHHHGGAGGQGFAADGSCEVCAEVWAAFVAVLRDAAVHAEGTVWTKRGLCGHEGGSVLHGDEDLYTPPSVPDGAAPQPRLATASAARCGSTASASLCVYMRPALTAEARHLHVPLHASIAARAAKPRCQAGSEWCIPWNEHVGTGMQCHTACPSCM